MDSTEVEFNPICKYCQCYMLVHPELPKWRKCQGCGSCLLEYPPPSNDIVIIPPRLSPLAEKLIEGIEQIKQHEGKTNE